MMRRIVAPSVGIVLAAAALGLAVNALRERDAIEIGRAYFLAAPGVPAVPPASAPTPARGPATQAVAPGFWTRAAEEFALIDGARARQLLEAARLDPTHVLFLDARSDGHYREDRIPGALQLDYYNLPQDVAPALPFLREVPWLVVYCESAECMDGYLLCRALVDRYGIARERLLLYTGGMRDWRERRLPVARGTGPW